MADFKPIVLDSGQKEQLQSGDNITVKTESPGDNSIKAASTAYVDAAVVVADNYLKIFLLGM